MENEVVTIHCCISTFQRNNHIAGNRLSIAKAGVYFQEQDKKKKKKKKKVAIVELFFKKLEAVVSVTFPEMNSSVDIFLRTYWRQKQLFLFCFKIDQNNFSYMCGSWKNHFFVCSVCYSTSVNGNFKETFYLACFCFYLHFKHFHTAAFLSSRKMATRIFSHPLWYHSLQTEQNAMKNPLFSFRSSSNNGTGHL